MSEYLLDTCAALWFFEGSPKINKKLLETLTDPTAGLYFSDISLLEITIKYQLGKLPLKQKPSQIIPRLTEEHGIETLSLSSESIGALESLPMYHRDPFDRLLIAQSLVHDLVLVTPDPLIRRYNTPNCWH